MPENNARRKGAIVELTDVYTALQTYEQKKNEITPKFFQEASVSPRCAQPTNKIEFEKVSCFNTF